MSALPDSWLDRRSRVGTPPRARTSWGPVPLIWQTAAHPDIGAEALGSWGPWCLLANDRYPPVFFRI